MPGRFFLERDLSEVADAIGLPRPEFTNPPRRNIAPGQTIAVATPQGLTEMRWGIIPVGRKNARGRPVMETIVNVRSETVFDKSAFDGLQRCVVPVDGWYEWTGEARKKTAWRIKRSDGAPLVFAAVFDIWNGPADTQVAQVAPLTCEPNGDVRDIHHRMGVILDPGDIDQWLTADTEKATELLRPLPDGQLWISPADDVDWSTD